MFLFLFCLYLLTSSGRVRTIDEVLVDLETESLATRGTTAVPQAVSAGIFYGTVDRHGNPQAPYGAGQAVASLPWFALGRAVRALLPGIPAQAGDAAGDAVLTASSAAYAALAATLFFLLLTHSGAGYAASLLGTFLLALATPLFAYSSWFFSEPLAAALLVGAGVALFPPQDVEFISGRRAAVAGALLGCALWVRPTHVIAVPVFVLAAAMRSRGHALRTAVLVAAVAGSFGAAYLLRNEFLFGSFFDFGYPPAAEGGRRLNTFETPLATGLYGLLFSPGKSLFLFAPPLLLALPGLWRLARGNRALAVVAGLTPLVYLLFFARYTQWEGGYCFGPRYLVPVIPLLALGLGPMLAGCDRRILRLAAVLAVAGFVVQGIGMSTSFLEDQAAGHYYDAQWNYRMSYAPLASQSRLLLHYLGSAGAAPMGRGFDRWFVFLSKAGVAHGTLAGVLGLELAGMLFFGWRLLMLARHRGPYAGEPPLQSSGA